MAYLKDSTIRASIAATDYIYFGSTANGDSDSKCLKSVLFTSPTMITPALGVASATSLAASGAITAASFNGLIVTTSTGTLTLANGSSLITSGAFAATLVIGANVSLTLPTTSATLARTDAAQTFAGTQTFSGTIAGAAITATSLTATAAITSNSPLSGIGYATGAGGAVTQASSRTTAVAMVPDPCTSGTITTHTASLAAEASADFVVTNSAVAIGDVVVVSIRSGSNGGGTMVSVIGVTNGTFTIRVHNGNVAAGTAETGAIVINFAIIKAVAS